MLLLTGLAGVLLLSACASPCERINADLRTLNAEMIRNPGILTSGKYASEFQELAARSVEHSCLQ